MEKKARKRRCVQCGKRDGYRQLDPYVLELYGEKVWMIICDRCVTDRADEI